MACPQVNEGDVKRLLEEAFSYSRNDIIYIKSLGSCQDANFKVKIRDSVCEKKFVLKFSNLKSTLGELKFQNDLIIHTAAMQLKKTNGSKDILFLPRPIEIKNLRCRVEIDNVPDKYIAQYRRRFTDETQGDEVYFVRLFSYVDGYLMSDAKHLSPYSLNEYGRFVAYFCDLTSHFREHHDHYAEIPPSDWAIETAVHHIKKYAATLSEVGQTAMFDSTIYKLLRANYGHVLGLDLLGSLSSEAVSLKEPLLALADAMCRRISDLNGSGQPFRRAVLHGDLALYNLVTGATQGQVDSGSSAVEVSGVIDFGDACESWVVGELVVAIASVHGKAAKQDAEQADSLLQAASMVAGFSQYCSRSGCPSLTEEEVSAIWPMLVLRAVLEMFVLAHQQHELQHSSDGSGSSSLKYCEDGLKGIKRAFAAVLRVPPYLAQAHLLSVAMKPSPYPESPSNHVVFEDCADNKTDCSSVYSISRSQSAIINDSSSALASPLPLRDSSVVGKFLSPADTPAYTPSTMTPVSSKDDLTDMDSNVFPAQHGGKRTLAVDFQILSTVFERSGDSNMGSGRRVAHALRYGSQHQEGVSLVSKLLFPDRQKDGDKTGTINRMTVELNAPWPFEASSVHFIHPLDGTAVDRDVTTRAEIFNERSLLLRSPPDSCGPDLLISADIIGPEDESVQFRLPSDQADEKGDLKDSIQLNPKGTVFASVEFATGSKPALVVQLIPKGADLTSSANYYPVSFLPPRYCPGVYRSTYGNLCPDPSALLPVLLSNYLEDGLAHEESENEEGLDSMSDYGVDVEK